MPFSERGIKGCLYGYWLKSLLHIVWCPPASYNLRRATIVCLTYPTPGFRKRIICRGSGEIFCFLDKSMAPQLTKNRWASKYFFFLLWLYTYIQFFWAIQCINFCYLCRLLGPFHIMLFFFLVLAPRPPLAGFDDLCQCYLVVMICLGDTDSWLRYRSRLDSIYYRKIIKQFC